MMENQSAQRNICSNMATFTTNPTQLPLGLNPGHHGEKLVNNNLTYGMTKTTAYRLLCACEGENLTRCFLTTETENNIIVNDKTILSSAINSAVIFLISNILYCHGTEWFITITPKPATGTHPKPTEFIHILTYWCFPISVFYSTPWPNIPCDTPLPYNTFQCYTALHGPNIPHGFQKDTLSYSHEY